MQFLSVLLPVFTFKAMLQQPCMFLWTHFLHFFDPQGSAYHSLRTATVINTKFLSYTLLSDYT